MLRIGSENEFQLTGAFLRQNYTEQMLTRELGITSIFDFHVREQGRPVNNVLAKLFFAGASLPAADVGRAIPGEALEAMVSLGLLNQTDDRYSCAVLVYALGNVLVTSDRLITPDGIQDPVNVPQDFVYLALTERTRSFLEMLPDRACDALLDMGAGSGAAALVASRYAKECWATDISARSTLFATFNARLNGFTNVHAIEGSLYEPLSGLSFDRIVCHPPYDPSLTSSWTFCDGGYDGEVVLRGVIAGLGAHLRPGGQLYAQARAGDRKGRPLQQRMREWLGDVHSEFDIAIIVRDLVQPEEFAIGSVMTVSRNMADYDAYLKRFREIELQHLVYCNILIERKTDKSEPLTLRRSIGKQATAAELEWLIHSQRTPSALEIKHCVPVISSDFELQVRHAFVSGELSPIEYLLRTTAPFREEAPCPPWVARLVAACDGKHTADQIYAHLRKQGPIQPHEFEGALKRLIGMGAVQATSPAAAV